MTFDTLKDRWNKGTISEVMLKIYVKKGIITKAQYKEITGKTFS